jgi:hypothetical protein
MPRIRRTSPLVIQLNATGSVASVLQNGAPLAQTLAANISQTGVTPQFHRILEDVLTHIVTLPHNQRVRAIEIADKLFEGLFGAYQIRYGLGNPRQLADYWYSVLDFLRPWERVHRRVHKGTLYFWLGYSHLAMGDVASAYFAFYEAINEDRRIYPALGRPYTQSPAVLTMTLSDTPTNALHPAVVVPLRNELANLLSSYQMVAGSHLSMHDVDSKFLQNPMFTDLAIIFVSTFHELFNLRRLVNDRHPNQFEKLRLGNLLFNLCLVVDQLLEHRFLRYSREFKKGDRDMGKAVYEIFLSKDITSRSATPFGGFFRNLHPPKRTSLANALTVFLSNGATFDGVSLRSEINCVLVAYRLRNFHAHNIKAEAILVSRYPDLYSSVMKSFFFAVENL